MSLNSNQNANSLQHKSTHVSLSNGSESFVSLISTMVRLRSTRLDKFENTSIVDELKCTRVDN